MNQLIDEIYKTKCVKDSEGRSVSVFPAAICYDEGRALYDLVIKTKAKNTLEIGMAYGLSTLFFCQAHYDKNEGSHIAIDGFQKTSWKSIGLLNVKRAGLEKFFIFHEALSHESLPKLLSDGERFDVVFVDGSHLFDHTLVEFFYIDKILRPGGYVVFDDLWMPSIRKAIGFILRNRSYKLETTFIWKRYPLWKSLLICLKGMIQMPFDLYSTMFSVFRLIKRLPNYCILRKITDDNRNWKHYRPF